MYSKVNGPAEGPNPMGSARCNNFTVSLHFWSSLSLNSPSHFSHTVGRYCSSLTISVTSARCQVVACGGLAMVTTTSGDGFLPDCLPHQYNLSIHELMCSTRSHRREKRLFSVRVVP